MLVKLNITEIEKFPQSVSQWDGTTYLGCIDPPYSIKIFAQSRDYNNIVG